MSSSPESGKSFGIAKSDVWEAYQQVAANKGAPGIDGQTLADFETDLRGNLYKIWNRMSSGSYFPPPVRAVEIPKAAGGVRVLGVPTVADRVAQTVVARRLGAVVELKFHADSYGYRPGRSALDAVAVARERCWTKSWVVDLDIRSFFDTVDHDLLVKAVEANTDDRWVVLYVKRWLRAPLALPDGTLQARDRGTPQGSAVSPVLANLFLHYAFDAWMDREYPSVRFERYVDDVVVHAVSQQQAQRLKTAIAARLAHLGLVLHPDKTRVVYCKDDRRRETHEHISFVFLGYEFRPRLTKASSGNMFFSFLPAVSKTALTAMSRQVRSWRLHRQTSMTAAELATRINPILRGWMNYYGRFRPSAMSALLQRVNTYLARWARRKYKGLRSFTRLKAWWDRFVAGNPDGFTHWRWERDFRVRG